MQECQMKNMLTKVQTIYQYYNSFCIMLGALIVCTQSAIINSYVFRLVRLICKTCLSLYLSKYGCNQKKFRKPKKFTDKICTFFFIFILSSQAKLHKIKSTVQLKLQINKKAKFAHSANTHGLS
jgi:hypothetical protein